MSRQSVQDETQTRSVLHFPGNLAKYMSVSRLIPLPLEALDRDVKKKDENPSIGILFCRHKDNSVVEYAMSRYPSPALVAEYHMKLPDKKLMQKKVNRLFVDGV